jgi:hypothetical protein
MMANQPVRIMTWSANRDGARYNPDADLKSWDALLALLDKTLK